MYYFYLSSLPIIGRIEVNCSYLILDKAVVSLLRAFHHTWLNGVIQSYITARFYRIKK